MKAEVQKIYGEYVKFAYHNEILVVTTTKLTSTYIPKRTNNEGKVADIAIIIHKPAHKFIAPNVCNSYMVWKAKNVKQGTFREYKRGNI